MTAQSLFDKHFTFVSEALAEDALHVVEFHGTEAMSRLFEFHITLVSEDAEIDMKSVVRKPATFTILRQDYKECKIQGVCARFEQAGESHEHYYYKAVLVPKLWRSDLYLDNQLFLDKSVPDIVKEILNQTMLTSLDYDFKLTRSYPAWEYVCQFDETDFQFVSRWMEREGIYYFFQQTDQSDRMVITDNLVVHEDVFDEKSLYFVPPSQMAPGEGGAVHSLVCKQKMLPKSVRLRDYNYRKPSLEMKAEADVDPEGQGSVYIYGEHFKSPEEGAVLAKIRAEEIQCEETVFYGESTAPQLRPGFIFELSDHYRKSYNQRYLVLEVAHRGGQSSFVTSGMSKGASEDGAPTYRNSFVAIPENVQYRPPRKTPKRRFYGAINAKVDAAGSGEYAEIDAQGRYKIAIPFDQSGKGDGKASRWVRMAQPYSGSGFGMHFPLHKNAEVLLTFIDGDPDRPIISGTTPNPDNQSPVTNSNQTKCVIRTGGENQIEMEDTAGSQRITMNTPHAKTRFSMGAPFNPGPGFNFDTAANWVANIQGFSDENIKGYEKSFVKGYSFKEVFGGAAEVILGGKASEITPIKQEEIFGTEIKTVQGLKVDIHHGWKLARSDTGECQFKPVKKQKSATADYKIGKLQEKVKHHREIVQFQLLEALTQEQEIKSAKNQIQKLEEKIDTLTQDIASWKAKVKGAIKFTAGKINQNAKACQLLMGDVAMLKKGGKKIVISGKVAVNNTSLVVK